VKSDEPSGSIKQGHFLFAYLSIYQRRLYVMESEYYYLLFNHSVYENDDH